MSDLIRIKRGTRAQLDAAAGTNSLHEAEPYLITDEERMAVGLGASSYAVLADLDTTVGTVEGATNALTFTGSNGIEVDATSTGTNSATVDISINQLGTYSETDDTLTSTAGALTIPLDGKTYTVTVTEDTAITFSLPASGRGSAIVHFIQDATGGRVVSFPAATEWADSTATDVATDANARTRAVFTQFSATGVDADLEVRGTVA